MKFRLDAWRLLLMFVAICIASSLETASAQVPPSLSQGLNPAATYSTNNFDNVDMSTGRLFMQIPLLADKSQRGKLNFTYSLTYSNPAWAQSCDDEGDCENYLSQGGVDLGPLPILGGALSCGAGSGIYVSAVAATEANGGSHPTGWMGSYYESVDGSGIQVSSDCSTLINNAGIRFVNNSSPYIEDTNGNVITMSGNTYADGFGPSLFSPAFGSWTMTDTVGRGWTFNANASTSGCPGSPTSATSWTVPGISGNTRQFTFCYSTITINPPWPNTFWYDGQEYTNPSSYQDTPLTAVVLPDGTTWQFEYTDGYGEVNTAILPTGGTVSYTYSPYTRTVNTRVACDNVNPCQTWTYDFSGFPSSSKVTDPLQNDTVYTLSPLGAPYMSEIQYYAGSASSGNWLKQVNKSYQTWTLESLPTGETTTLPNNQVSQWTQTYDSGFNYTWCDAYGSDCNNYNAPYGLVTSEIHYDWGSGSPNPNPILQKYMWYIATSYGGDYLSGNLLSLLAQESTYGAAGQCCFVTYYGYNGGTVSSGITMQHTSPPNSVTGNLTAITQWDSATSTNVTVASFTNYDTGMVQQKIDAMGNSTTYSYDASYAGAYPTFVCNVLSQCSFYWYDWTSGSLTLSADPNELANGTLTTYSYDIMFRPTQINYPDGGQTSFTYPSPTETVETSAITNSIYNRTHHFFDGLGRQIQTQLTSDPDGTVNTDTIYDGLGRVHSVSNPYRSTSDPTYGITTYQYDALGRVVLQTNPDGSQITTSYTGRATSVTDEGGVQRISQADALGRATSVCEVTSAAQMGSSGTPTACGQDIGGTGFLTTYAWDAMNNLSSVSQGGLNRTFAYDAMSRLTSASNPESGTTYYSYRNSSGSFCSGDLSIPCLRTDARNITTTYSYDQLNRLLSKTYNDGITPLAEWYWGNGPLTVWGQNISNPVGNMLSVDTYSPQWGWTASLFNYDSMGRVTQASWCIPTICTYTGSWNTNLNYTYDLAGDLTSSTNGMGVTLSYSYNGSQQVTGVYSTFSGNVLSSAHYNGSGALTSATLGSTLIETRAYDNRMRLTGISDNAPGNTLYSWSGTYSPSSNFWGTNDSVNGNWLFQNDGLNRLVASAGPPVSYNYSYDRFGNRWKQTVTNGAGPQSSLSFSGNNNHIDGYSYDAAGNLTYDGTHHYYYDAENRVIQVDGTFSNWPTSCSSATACYIYDGNGNRVRSIVGGVATDFLNDPDGHQAAVVSGSGSWVRSEVGAAGRDWATSIAAGATYWHFSDQLGTERVRATILSSGAWDACETITSLPFGDDMAINSLGCGDPSPMHFTGKERDSETGNDNFGARYFGSSMGRFLSPDPSGISLANLGDPQQLNMYAYTRNNPINLTDPTGLCTYTDHWNNQGTGLTQEPSADCNDLDQMGNPDQGPHLCSGNGCVSSGGMGIFDAISNAPGTFTTTDMYGNMHWGFSSDGWITAMDAKDQALDSDPIYQQFVQARRDQQQTNLAAAIAAHGLQSYADIYGLLIYAKTTGGNANFQYTGIDLSFLNPVFPSGQMRGGNVHTKNGLIHLDHANPFSHFPLGALGHGLIDILLGNIAGSVPLGF